MSIQITLQTASDYINASVAIELIPKLIAEDILKNRMGDRSFSPEECPSHAWKFNVEALSRQYRQDLEMSLTTGKMRVFDKDICVPRKYHPGSQDNIKLSSLVEWGRTVDVEITTTKELIFQFCMKSEYINNGHIEELWPGSHYEREQFIEAMTQAIKNKDLKAEVSIQDPSSPAGFKVITWNTEISEIRDMHLGGDFVRYTFSRKDFAEWFKKQNQWTLPEDSYLRRLVMEEIRQPIYEPLKNDEAKDQHQSKAASRPRKSRQRQDERRIVEEYWDKWQVDPKLYTDTSFDLAMLDKTGILRQETIRGWRKKLKKGERLTG